MPAIVLAAYNPARGEVDRRDSAVRDRLDFVLGAAIVAGLFLWSNVRV